MTIHGQESYKIHYKFTSAFMPSVHGSIVLGISVVEAHHPYLLNAHSVYWVLGTQLKVTMLESNACLSSPLSIWWGLKPIIEWIRAVFHKVTLSWMNKQIQSFNTIWIEIRWTGGARCQYKWFIWYTGGEKQTGHFSY